MKRPKSSIVITDEQRAQAVEAISQACQEPVPEIIEIEEMLGTDGQYYRLGFGLPRGVQAVQPYQIRPVGFVYRSQQGQTFGTRAASREELKKRWQGYQQKEADQMRREMQKASVRRLIEVANYWLKEQSPWWGVTP
jgi:hypothetical protein